MNALMNFAQSCLHIQKWYFKFKQISSIAYIYILVPAGFLSSENFQPLQWFYLFENWLYIMTCIYLSWN